MKETITLIVPVYNAEPYLAECLDSIVNQTVLFDEVILINDGSTDNSLLICQQYTKKYSNFKLINQDNKGVSVARNIGIEAAQNNYIMFLDSDDYLRKDTCAILKEQIQKYKSDAVSFDAEIIFEEESVRSNRNEYDRSFCKMDKVPMSGWNYMEKSYPRYYTGSACMAVYCKKVVEKGQVIFPEKLRFEDNYFTFAFLCQVQSIQHISEGLYLRRYRKNSFMTSEYSEKKFTDYIQCTELIWKKIRQLEAEIIRERKNLLLHFINDYCDAILKNYKNCEKKNIIISKEAEQLLLQIIEEYFVMLKYISDGKDNISNTNQFLIIKNLWRIYNWNLKKNDFLKQEIHVLAEKEKKFYSNILSKLPFKNENLKIGIYGLGKHTEGVFSIYENLFGDIKCQLVFIESQKRDESYRGKELIIYKEIDDSFDFIIISSFLYEDNMIENLKHIGTTVPIVTFYEEETTDIFSDVDIFWERV